MTYDLVIFSEVNVTYATVPSGPVWLGNDAMTLPAPQTRTHIFWNY